MKKQVEAVIPTRSGAFNMIAYSDDLNEPMPHLALVHPEIDISKPVFLRIHSECLTGDLFGSHRCDCGEQLDNALEMIATKKGVVLYLRQEGRGIGLINKLKAYNLQDQGLNTADANVHLGLEIDARQYDIAVAIIKDLGIRSIHLITNNPLKIEAIEKSSIEVKSRVPIIITPKQENKRYLKTKEELMGHLLKSNGKP
ncbi:MAG: GTP cyclohydrolase II [Saprospiraceae bacterium]|jgi:GTP cyclohydrolase II